MFVLKVKLLKCVLQTMNNPHRSQPRRWDQKSFLRLPFKKRKTFPNWKFVIFNEKLWKFNVLKNHSPWLQVKSNVLKKHFHRSYYWTPNRCKLSKVIKEAVEDILFNAPSFNNFKLSRGEEKQNQNLLEANCESSKITIKSIAEFSRTRSEEPDYRAKNFTNKDVLWRIKVHESLIISVLLLNAYTLKKELPVVMRGSFLLLHVIERRS